MRMIRALYVRFVCAPCMCVLHVCFISAFCICALYVRFVCARFDRRETPVYRRSSSTNKVLVGGVNGIILLRGQNSLVAC